jgi:hypothetical protein
VPEQEWLKIAAEWGEEDLYQGYQSENEVFLAVAQGKADIGITTNTAVKPISEQYDTVIPARACRGRPTTPRWWPSART